STGMDGTVRLWDAATGKLVRSLKHSRFLGGRPIAYIWNDQTLTSLTENQLRLWDVKTGEQLCDRILKQEQDQVVSALALSSDSKTVATGGADGIIRLWDAATGNVLRVLAAHEKPTQGKPTLFLFFSPDNKTLASASAADAKVVLLW